MIGSNTIETALAGIEASLKAKLPLRTVQRSLLLDPGSHDLDALKSGVLCLVNGGGGRFANYRGREGQLGHARLGVVGFVAVAEDAAPVAVEQAELALLQEVLGWVKEPGMPRPWDTALPGDFRQSGQIEFPFGWFVLELDVRP